MNNTVTVSISVYETSSFGTTPMNNVANIEITATAELWEHAHHLMAMYDMPEDEKSFCVSSQITVPAENGSKHEIFADEQQISSAAFNEVLLMLFQLDSTLTTQSTVNQMQSDCFQLAS